MKKFALFTLMLVMLGLQGCAYELGYLTGSAVRYAPEIIGLSHGG